MRHPFMFLVLLCLAPLAIADPLSAIPDPRFLVALQDQYAALSRRSPEFAEILERAIQKSGSPSKAEFFLQIRYCRDDSPWSGTVERNGETRVTWLGRALEEPVGLEKPEELKNFYRDQYKEHFASGDVEDWRFEPDMVVLINRRQGPRIICLKPGLRADAAAAAVLAHELYHYVYIPENNEVDVLSFKDRDDYAMKTALATGDEVDAHIFTMAVNVRLAGLAGLKAPQVVRALFSPRGEFTGKREDMARYILDDLGYRARRFYPEYDALVQRQIKINHSELEVADKLIHERQSLSSQLAQDEKTRWWVWNLISPAYSAGTQRLQKLETASRDSLVRLRARINILRDRSMMLTRKLTR